MEAIRFKTEVIFAYCLGGMVIGAVDSLHITEETPLDPEQWGGGSPWFWKPKT